MDGQRFDTLARSLTTAGSRRRALALALSGALGPLLARQDAAPHVVTGLSCDCRGFMEHQRCTHHALLLDRLGWIPEVEPELPSVEASPADCVECCGCGVQDFGRYALPCETCGGSGVRPSHHPHGAPPVQPAALADVGWSDCEPHTVDHRRARLGLPPLHAVATAI